MEKVDCVIIGAGVVGLAIARRLSAIGREVIILESTDAVGSGISSRNSEVVHAGIYYPKDSLKARLCVAGRQLLYDYCDEHHVSYRRCGKLIVATAEEQLDMLDDIRRRAAINGVDDLQWLTASEAQQLEPAIYCSGALLSPSTGIVDTHGFMLSLLGEAEACGAMLACGARVSALSQQDDFVRLTVEGDEPVTLDATLVINSAGLGAVHLARSMAAHQSQGSTGQVPCQLPTQMLAKGNYFGLVGASPVSRLIYPVPEPGGLGVHITLDLAGRVRFGPDVEWIADVDYSVDPARADSFYAAIRRYWPQLADGALVPDYAGVRPKIAYDNQVHADFMISAPRDHGINGLVHLLGIESPGLTSSLAIADYVVELLNQPSAVVV